MAWVYMAVGPGSVDSYVDTPRTVLAVIASLGILPGSALAGVAASGLAARTRRRLRRAGPAICMVGIPLALAPFVAAATADETVATGDPPVWLVVLGTAALLAVLAVAGSRHRRRATVTGQALAAALTILALARDLLA